MVQQEEAPKQLPGKEHFGEFSKGRELAMLANVPAGSDQRQRYELEALCAIKNLYVLP